MKKDNELIDVGPIIEAVKIFSEIGIEACEKIERNEPISFVEREVLLLTPFANTALKRTLKKEVIPNDLCL